MLLPLSRDVDFLQWQKEAREEEEARGEVPGYSSKEKGGARLKKPKNLHVKKKKKKKLKFNIFVGAGAPTRPIIPPPLLRALSYVINWYS